VCRTKGTGERLGKKRDNERRRIKGWAIQGANCHKPAQKKRIMERGRVLGKENEAMGTGKRGDPKKSGTMVNKFEIGTQKNPGWGIPKK